MIKKGQKNKAQFDSDRIFRRRLNFPEGGGKNQHNPLFN